MLTFGQAGERSLTFDVVECPTQWRAAALKLVTPGLGLDSSTIAMGTVKIMWAGKGQHILHLAALRGFRGTRVPVLKQLHE